MNEKVIVLGASGDISILKTNPDENGLIVRDLQLIVGGFIEIVTPIRLRTPYMAVCDEEGILKNKKRNKAGSLLCGVPIVGDIVILKEGNRNGEIDIFGMDDDEATELAKEFMSSYPWLKFLVHT